MAAYITLLKMIRSPDKRAISTAKLVIYTEYLRFLSSGEHFAALFCYTFTKQNP